MKRLYAAMCALLLTGVLLIGCVSILDKDATYSAREKRPLKTKPKFRVSALLDGSLLSDFVSYFADTFPGREKLMDTNQSLNGFYYFGGLGSSNVVIIDKDSNAGDHGESLQGNGTLPTLPPKETRPGETEEPTQEPTDPPGVAEQLGSVVVIGDRAVEIAYSENSQIQAYADAVNKIANAMGSDIRTFCVLAPNGAEFYTPKEFHTGSNSQKAKFEQCKDAMGSNVHYVDAYSTIARHTSEYLYFRTDHHWTQLGAYYAYQAYCESAGLKAVSLEDFKTGQWDNFVGSLYTAISDHPQSKVLKENPDTVYYYEPNVDYTAKYYTSTALSDPIQCYVISNVRENVGNKYLTFMGGDHPITIVETGVEGPVCLLVKESYGNAFATWLINNYSKVILVDPREFNRGGNTLDLAAFAREQGVDDCIILDYPIILGSSNYIKWLGLLAGN